MDRLYFTDTAAASLEYTGEGTLTTDDFSPSDAETVTRDGPWTDFFDTNEFVQFDATVARPIVQPYVHKGKLQFFKKDEAEFKRTQAQLQHLPWTIEHPDEGRIKTTDDIRGIWENPRYEDGQQATLNVPANDPDAIQFAVDSQGVSMGFSGTIEWVDDESVDYDGVQRDYVYDHVASVDDDPPRCPPERGCGLHTDAIDTDPANLDGHGHVHDAAQTPNVDESVEWSAGDWVAFTTGGERHHGKLVHVDAERALVRQWITSEERFNDQSTAVATENLSEWVGPFEDSCPGDTCHCGCHVASTTNQSTTADSMTTIHEFIDENDLEREDVLDSLNVEQNDAPTDFYDGQPSADELAEDFDAVDLLLDSKNDLEDQVEDLQDALADYEQREAEEKIETLTDITDKWDADDLTEQYEDGDLTLDRIEERIEIARDLVGDQTTTVEDETDDGGDVADHDLDTTESGGFDLRTRTK